MKSVLTGVILLCSLNANTQVTRTKTISIEPDLSLQNYEHFKRFVLDSPDSHAEYVDGFEFEWGYYYKLSVKETELEETLSDGTQYSYALDHIISKIKAPDSLEFKLYIDPERYYYELPEDEADMNITLKQINDSTYLYHEEVEIEVPLHLREKFETLIDKNTPKLGQFVFVNEKCIRLISI
ncbi:DUF4377 domain-containing protein [Crocinitomix sp.]|nr:DUF4377 domain-containing protein [Crocinitomix sp.]